MNDVDTMDLFFYFDVMDKNRKKQPQKGYIDWIL